jgi:ABC-type polysaccharide/polyol phosphate transport system ATPase subunit
VAPAHKTDGSTDQPINRSTVPNRSTAPVVSAQNISKLYQIYNRPVDRLREALGFGRRRLHQDFWALRDVNLTIEKGETLGIVGPNGCGKSTLLQVLCGILQPTTGRVVRQGRVAALLELGAGFNPEFSGRENVYINGEIMGLGRAHIDRAFPSIERFAGIGEFIDRPVKTYSTGMYVRLAFSTAIHVNPDILVVDEALAVGDAVFANRCIRKFEELQQQGVTVIFVSHDLGLVKQISSRAIFLLDGRIQAEGSPADVINRYVGTVLERQKALGEVDLRSQQAEGPEPALGGADGSLPYSHRHGDRAAEIMEVELLGADGCPARTIESGQPARVRLRAKFHAEQPEPMAGMLIRTRTGMDAFGTNSKLEAAAPGPCKPGDTLEVEFAFECWLAPQEYTLTVAVQHPDGHSHDWLDDVITFRVLDPRRLAGVANLHPKVQCRVY